MTMHTDPTVPPVADAPKKKNWFARHKVLTTIGAIILVIVIVNATKGGDPAPSDSAATSESSAPAAEQPAETEAKTEDKTEEKPAEKVEEKPSTPGFGVPVTESDLEFTALSIASAGTQVGSEYLNAQAQGTFQRLTIRVKNVGKTGQTFTTSSLTIVDQEGREFDADTTATTYADIDKSIWLTSINPGNSVEGDIIFDLPAGAVPTTLIAKGGFFGSGVEISLVK